MSDETLRSILDMIDQEFDPPDCLRGERILVKARVHLDKHTERDGSIKGAPEETVYLLVIDELLDVFWSGQSCE